MRETLAGGAGRERVALAIERQRDHFDTIGLQLGIAYDEGALVADGSPKPVATNRGRDHVPSTRPGARLPHAWVERDGARVSTLDLVGQDRFTLIAGSGVSPRVAEGIAPSLRVLVAGRDFTDPDGRWTRLAVTGDD